jgi:catechol 2,3-dioxygenase-like lactoylglutathione lyase family enzyme
MGKVNGVHHLAISTARVKEQIEFFTDVLGAELKAMYWMHGAEKTFHAFLRLSDSSYVAFVQSDATKTIEGRTGVSHAAGYDAPSAPGTMQHVAFNVETDEDQLAMRDRIRSRGINVFGPLDHGMCKSIYFAGPEGLLLEVATSETVIDEKAWIDPEVVALAGISPDELAGYLQPREYRDEAGAVPQPAIDWSKPHFLPKESFEWLMTTSDEDIIRRLSQPQPPVLAPGD